MRDNATRSRKWRLRDHALRVLGANLRKRGKVLFELPAQTAQVDHSVPSSELIEGGPRLIGLGLFIQLGEIRNNREHNAVRRTWPQMVSRSSSGDNRPNSFG